jgi:uncharacterized protein YdeI (YjbR/CyaY-like superfamily)
VDLDEASVDREAVTRLGIGPAYAPRSREEWRTWLEQHASAEKEIWLVFFKKRTGEATLTLPDAVEEALCFGWIDSRLRRVDDKRYALRFSPRRPGSIWSESNKARVRKMIAEGKMTKEGMALVEAGKRSGEWEGAADRENAYEPPPDLAAALAQNVLAKANLEHMSPSQRRAYFYWVTSAKHADTRLRRVEEVVARAERNERPGEVPGQR